MAQDAANVRVAVTGAVYSAAIATTAPTGTASSLSAWDDLGYVSEDGITLTPPDSGDSEPIHAWQNGQTVRTVRSAAGGLATLGLTLIETKIDVIETVFGVTVTSGASEGSFELDSNDTRTPLSFAVDVVDGSELIRLYVPRGVVTAVGEISLTNTSAIGYQITVECERDATKGYNLKSWMTALKTPA